MKIETALFISESEPCKEFYQHYSIDNGTFTTRYEVPVLNPVAKFNLKPKTGKTVPQISCFITNGEKTKMPF